MDNIDVYTNAFVDNLGQSFAIDIMVSIIIAGFVAIIIKSSKNKYSEDTSFNIFIFCFVMIYFIYSFSILH